MRDTVSKKGRNAKCENATNLGEYIQDGGAVRWGSRRTPERDVLIERLQFQLDKLLREFYPVARLQSAMVLRNSLSRLRREFRPATGFKGQSTYREDRPDPDQAYLECLIVERSGEVEHRAQSTM